MENKRLVMVYDCFTFFNEFDLLEIRLALHDSFVDYFVISEADKTWTGSAKPLHLKESLARFSQYAHKIILLDSSSVLSGNNRNPWKNEEEQRNYLANGIQAADDNDIVLLSDVDEIYDSKVIDIFQNMNGPARVEMSFYYYYFCWRVNEQWTLPIIARKKDLANVSLNDWRQKSILTQTVDASKQNSLHLSFFYGNDVPLYSCKITSFSHQEYNRPINIDPKHIQYCINYGHDILRRPNIKMTYSPNQNFIETLNQKGRQDIAKRFSLPNLVTRCMQYPSYFGYLLKLYAHNKYGVYDKSNSLLYWIKFMATKALTR